MRVTEKRRLDGICFMLNLIKLNYEDMIKNEFQIVNDLSKNSDAFSLSPIIKKPYTQNPPLFAYCEKLTPYIQKYIFEKSKFPITFLGGMKHQIMIICRCCKDSRMTLLELPNLFLASENGVPENLCFYRNNIWHFASISHEHLAFMRDVSDQTLQFLCDNNIRYSLEN